MYLTSISTISPVLHARSTSSTTDTMSQTQNFCGAQKQYHPLGHLEENIKAIRTVTKTTSVFFCPPGPLRVSLLFHVLEVLSNYNHHQVVSITTITNKLSLSQRRNTYSTILNVPQQESSMILQGKPLPQ